MARSSKNFEIKKIKLNGRLTKIVVPKKTISEKEFIEKVSKIFKEHFRGS